MRARFALMLCAFAAFGGHAFAQQCPTGVAPVAQSPNGTNQNEGVPITFSWSPTATSGVTSYDVLVTTGNGGPNLICSAAANANSCNGPAGGFGSGQYTWAVRANFANCNLVSSVKQFTVNCLTGTPTIQSPSDGAQNVLSNPTLTWSPVSGANQYDVYFGISGSGACTGTPQFTTSNTSFNPPVLASSTSYEWRVVAKKTTGTCPVTTSGCAKFTTIAASCTPPGSFNLTAPADKSTTSSTPTLTWSASFGADKYVLHISTQNPPAPTTSDPVVNGTATSFTFAQALPAGTYYWSLDAYPPNCTTGKTSSNVFSFTVAAPTCPTAAATLITPANNTTVNTPVSFDWSDVSGATFYKVITSVNGAAAAVLAVTRDSHYEGSLPAGASVDWWTEAGAAANCASIASAHAHFNVTAASVCPTNPQQATLDTPANGATGLASPVRFEWEVVPGATNYVVWGMAANATSSNDRFVLGKTGGTHITVPVPQGSMAWYVEADFGACPAATYSKVFTFSSATPDVCSGDPATLLSPVNGATGLTSPVTFQWPPVVGATGYKLYIAQANISSGDLAGTTTSTTLTTLVPGGTVTWWVVTTFAGCPDVVSAKSTFTSGTQTTCGASATLNSPADGATVSSPVTLSWSAVSGASAYRLWISVNGSSPILAARTSTASAT